MLIEDLHDIWHIKADFVDVNWILICKWKVVPHF